jgi:lipopolysaccharide cholinephosphotransferase
MNAQEIILKQLDDGTTITLKDLHTILLSMMKDVDQVLRQHNLPYFLNGGSALGAYRHQGFIPWDDDIDIAMMMDDFIKAIPILENELKDKYIIHCFETRTCYNVLIPGMKIRLKNTRIEEVNELLSNKCKDSDGIFIDVFVYSKVNASKVKDLPLRLINQALMPVIVFFENLNINPVWIKKWFKWNAKVYHQLNHNSKWVGFDLTWTFKSAFNPFVFKEDDIFPCQEMDFEGERFFVPKNIETYLATAIAPTFRDLPPEHLRKPKHLKDIEL